MSCYVCGSDHTETCPTECQSWVPSDDHWMPHWIASHVSSSFHRSPSLLASWWQNEGWRCGTEERSLEAGDFSDPNHRHKAMRWRCKTSHKITTSSNIVALRLWILFSVIINVAVMPHRSATPHTTLLHMVSIGLYYRYVHVAMATKPMHWLQICQTVHN